MRTRILAPVVCAGFMLFAQSAQAGWIMDWIHCSEDCGWICGCDGGDELSLHPQNPKEKRAAEEIMKVMHSFQANIQALSPEAKELLKRADKKADRR